MAKQTKYQKASGFPVSIAAAIDFTLKIGGGNEEESEGFGVGPRGNPQAATVVHSPAEDLTERTSP
ncbi:MAG TPA: hypothetical protein VJS69_13780, partial [Candidatus Krumholzibacteria bacterium]|nr:hypothetical protein [Candidatus Krumholzibacteria bacterium]